MTICKAIAWSVTAAGIALATAPVAHAATMTGLFNTGTDANNVALVGGDGIIDMHYSIVSSTLPGVVGNQGVTYSNGAYFPDDSNSRWISGDASGLPFVGTTVFRLTLSLAGLARPRRSSPASWVPTISAAFSSTAKTPDFSPSISFSHPPPSR